MDLTLVVMAAGIGSRFGGIKQMEVVGACGELIIDYSIYDAIKAGFNKVVFIIRRDIEIEFKKSIGDRLSKFINISYVYQDNDNLPEGIMCPPDRVKPWGTAHAVLCTKNVVNTPFAVINADDFYGSISFKKLADFLLSIDDEKNLLHCCMVGFNLYNTLSENGYVSRGVCSIDSENTLKDIVEYTKIRKNNNKPEYTLDENQWIDISADTVVSMNMWGFTPHIFEEIENGMVDFLNQNLDKLSTVEYYLPYVVDSCIKNNKVDVKVLDTSERWYGITYKEDKDAVCNAIKDKINKGLYPNNLWD